MPTTRAREDEPTSRIVKRLDAILKLQLETGSVEGKRLSLSNKVDVLDSANFRPVEIAKLLGKTSKHITVELARIRKSRRRKSS